MRREGVKEQRFGLPRELLDKPVVSSSRISLQEIS